MKMKKYTAETMVEAMKKIRADFGDDAVIISSNVVATKGFLGLFKKKSVEVVAGFDEPALPIPAQAVAPSTPVRQPIEIQEESSEKLQKELREMKQLLQQMQQTSTTHQFPEQLAPLIQTLEKQQVASMTIQQVATELFRKMKEDKRDYTNAELIEEATAWLLQQLRNLSFGGISYKKKYINVVGPTGVGKTTTIAKIAARALLEKKKKIGFITTDTYRIAAIEQLRTYANLLQAPVEVAYNHSDFQAAIEKLADRDLIFIDTAGRNYKESKFISDLQNLVDFSLEMETFLVLSMTSKEEDMRMIVDQFSAFPIEKFIFTKFDETNSIGPMYNLMKQYEIGTAYYTDGQEVPEDLTEAKSEELIQLLLKGTYHA